MILRPSSSPKNSIHASRTVRSMPAMPAQPRQIALAFRERRRLVASFMRRSTSSLEVVCNSTAFSAVVSVPAYLVELVDPRMPATASFKIPCHCSPVLTMPKLSLMSMDCRHVAMDASKIPATIMFDFPVWANTERRAGTSGCCE